MKKLFMFIVACTLFATSCDNNDIDIESPNPKPSVVTDLEYEDIIGTWNVLELRKDKESKFTSLEKNSQNVLIFGENSIKVQATIVYDKNNKFSEECSFINYSHFYIEEGVVKGYLNKGSSMVQVMFDILDLDSDTGIVTIENKMTRSYYKILRQD